MHLKNHKKNMRNTFKQMRKMENQESKLNGEETSMFIYGDIIKDYIQEFKKEKEEKEEEANQLRQLKNYLQDISLEDGDTNKHLEQHSRREAEMIAKELELVNAEIKEIGTLTSSKYCD
jgi:coenzyme F420-reducing hydrogenase delta subunit